VTTAQDGGKVVSLTHRPPLHPGNNLVLISGRGRVDPRAIVRSNSNSSNNNSSSSCCFCNTDLQKDELNSVVVVVVEVAAVLVLVVEIIVVIQVCKKMN